MLTGVRVGSVACRALRPERNKRNKGHPLDEAEGGQEFQQGFPGSRLSIKTGRMAGDFLKQ